ncbi:peptide chain release factor N(5)-glutamine methyltransferase [Patescibacteria group bacterium]|nr:peptide chain release factor N(5)-glutamine methyltransferase [Patescibacteria group bacterium]
MNSISKALIQAINKLNDYSTSASLDAEVLLSSILKKDKSYLLANPDIKLNIFQQLKYNRLINKRIKQYPIAYITGSKEFYGLDFKVNKYTLVPRPESELFIDELKKINPINKAIVDIGTGCGCLIISTAKHIPNNSFLGIDISKKALKVAKQNASKHNINMYFMQNDLLTNLNVKIDILIANLPYLTPEQMNETSIIREPSTALLSGADGLDHYRKLLKQVKNLEYKPEYILLEINPEQAKTLIIFINRLLPNYSIEEIKDLTNKVRLLKIILI